jgi:IS1 family transposase
VCGQSVSLRYGTAYWDLNAPEEVFDTAVRALAEGVSLRSTARIVQIDKDTACDWLDRAAHHCRLVMLSLWRNLAVRECQLDELWSFVHTKEQHLATAKVVADSYGDTWIWIAFAPEWRLVVAFLVGKRTQDEANLLVKRVAFVSPNTTPFFTSDQLPAYREALLEVYGRWEQPKRKGARGPHPQRRRVAPPELVYAQVVKQRERGRVVAVTTKVIFGDSDAVSSRLARSEASTTINTSFVERQNLSVRQQARRLTRKTNGFSKEMPWLEKQLWLSLAYYHLVLPHDSLRQELATHQPTRGSGSPRRWTWRTPAMAAGITDHVWTTRELLSYRVSTAFLDQLDEIERLFPSPHLVHQGS